MYRWLVLLLLPILLSCIQRGAGSPGAPDPGNAQGYGHAHGRTHMEPGTVQERLARYEDPERAVWQKPDEVVAALALPADATVVDLGSGSGYFSVRLARAVPRGRVIGLDIEPAFVEHLHQRAKREGLSNLEVRQVPPDDPRLDPATVDLVLILDVYHHLENRPVYLGKLREALRPGGRIAVIDFTMTAGHGPPPKHRLKREEVLREAAEAGLTLAREQSILPEQYFLELEAR